MAKEAKGDTQLGWIYEGTKALVNREDYLLGKRLDKNFEMYSDVVVKEKESGIEALIEGRTRSSEASTSKVSNLGVNIVRNEDPLVAIKVKEEKLRQEKLENPLMLLKIQKILKEAMEKKARKMKKKEKMKKKRKKSTSSSDGNEHHSRKKERTAHSHKHVHKHRSGSAPREKKRRHLSSNNSDEMAVDERKNHHARTSGTDERSDKTGHRQATSSSSDEKRQKMNDLSIKKSTQLDSHIPEHLRRKYDDSSSSSSESPSPRGSPNKTEQKQSHIKGYGLVGAKKERNIESEEHVHNPYELALFKPTVEPYKREERRKLTREEMEAKRREMMKNAEWRNAIRSRNIDRAKRDDDAERKDEQTKVADFIRPLLNSAASSMTIEQQLSTHRQGLQRKHGYMEEKFVNRH